MLSDCTGLLAEFVDAPISLEITNGTTLFQLAIFPSTVDNVFKIRCGNEWIGATVAQAKEHILLALDMAGASTYADSHHVLLKVPFLPNMAFAVSDTDKVMDLVKKALDKYF